MIRSFWRIPRAAWLDAEGNPPSNVVVFDETPAQLYVMAAEETRPDLAAAGTFLGATVRTLVAANKARFLRVEVERDTPEGKRRVQVKAADKRPADVTKKTDIPAVIWMGDDPADYAP